MASISHFRKYRGLRCILLVFLTSSFVTNTKAQETTVGSNIVSRTMLSSDSARVLEQHVYDNGLGDVIQEVQSWPGSSLPDLVVHHEYDEYRRKTRSWLPITSSTNGSFVSRNMIADMATSQYSDTAPFTRTEYDRLLPSKPSAQYKAGAQWQSNDKKDSIIYSTYKGCAMYSYMEGYLFITDPYAEFLCTRTIDEDGCWKAEYTDMNGRLMISEDSQGKTFYMYDHLGNITYVIPPILAEYLISFYGFCSIDIPDTEDMMQKYCYIYRYDKQGHCLYKKLPGCDPIYYVYDRTGTCILSQDGEQRKSGVWAYSIPDKFGRPCISGICHNSIAYTSEPLHSSFIYAEYDGTSVSTGGYTIQNITLDSQTMYAATYYDNYNFVGQHGVPSSLTASVIAGFPIDSSLGHGMQTGSAVAILKDCNVTGYTYSATYYDSRYNVSQIKATNNFGGTETTSTSYTYTGKPQRVKIQHSSSTTGLLTENITYAYDEADRLSSRTISVANGISPQTITFGYEYDALGRLSDVSRSLTGSTSSNITYTYDLHGWTTGITTNSFSEELFYANGPGSHYYNGNIGSIRWFNDDYYRKRGYKFTYDDAGRMTIAQYGEGETITSANKFGENLEYDAHGNITRIIRRGRVSSNSYGVMDNLTLSYDGNQLTGVTESASDYDFAGSFEYKRAKGSQYIYNDNGSLVADMSRGIAYITYDFLNNPQTIYFTNGNMTKYTYSAFGEKLSVEHYNAEPNITWAFGIMPDTSQSRVIYAGNTDYLLDGNLIVQHGLIQKLLFDGGYLDARIISQSSYVFTPYYYNRDHLGNNREVINSNGTVFQVTNYYPFGAPYTDPSAVKTSSFQQYKYNGKELDIMHGLNTYDYGSRQYYPILGRWDRMDSFSEKYYNVSPYVYCEDDPVASVDPDGRSGIKVLLKAAYKIGKNVVKNGAKSLTNAATYADAFNDVVSDAKTLFDSNASGWDRTMAGVSLLSEAISPVSIRDVKEVKNANTLIRATKNNYRKALQKATGKEGRGYEAHHTLPQKHRDKFEKLGINIDEPGNVVWRKTENHRKNNHNITKEWNAKMRNKPTKESVVKHRDEIEKKYYGNMGDVPNN